MSRVIFIIFLLFPFHIHAARISSNFPRSFARSLFSFSRFRRNNQIYPEDIDIVLPKEEVEQEESVTSISVESVPRKDLDFLSYLSVEALSIIFDFQDQNSLLNLRLCNKELLKSYTRIQNFRFMRQLRPKITFKTQLFEEKKLASTLLFHFLEYFKDLMHESFHEFFIKGNSFIETLSEEQKQNINSVLISLTNPSEFESFLQTAIIFYYYTNPVVEWNLIEVSMKSDILHLEDLHFLPELNYKVAFESACEFGLDRLSKELLLHSTEFSLNLVDGCVRCINRGEMAVFKNILKTATDLKSFRSEEIIFLLETSIKSIKPDFAEILFKTFPYLKFLPTNSIFFVIKSKDVSLLAILLKYRGDFDFENLNEELLNPFEVSAKNNFWKGINLMSNYYNSPSIRTYCSAMRHAIQSEHYISVAALIQAIKSNFGSFSVLTGPRILRLIINAIDKRNLSILNIILSHSTGDVLNINDNDCRFGPILENYLNPIFRVIKQDYLEGFMCLMNHFGPDILDQKDLKGLTPFLYAASLGNIRLFRQILSIKPESVNQVDYNGNNAIHIALKVLPNPVPFVTGVLDLKIDLNHLNNENESPIDIFFKHPAVTSEDLNLFYNICVLKYDNI